MSESSINNLQNLLPFDGDVRYTNAVFSQAEKERLFATMLNTIKWKHDEVTIFGKHYITSRKTAWYASGNIAYSYSGIGRPSLPFTNELQYLENLISRFCGDSFNGCLLNLYHHGDEGMGWHSDDEKSIVEGSTIASLSFGAERRFAFRHKQTKQKVELMLENGSLLLMRGSTQLNWHHALMKSKKVTTPRINLTFRLMK